ncbi:MAG: hypothetical protein JXA03_02265 [Bacteroidales bacterium]|nr:hypothetical protein [Bacteroidales bacterium]
MLRYTKLILQKVSFNRELFAKELLKSLKWLKKEEIILLNAWCMIQYGNVYGDVIKDVFSGVNI